MNKILVTGAILLATTAVACISRRNPTKKSLAVEGIPCAKIVKLRTERDEKLKSAGLIVKLAYSTIASNNALSEREADEMYAKAEEDHSDLVADIRNDYIIQLDDL